MTVINVTVCTHSRTYTFEVFVANNESTRYIEGHVNRQINRDFAIGEILTSFWEYA